MHASKALPPPGMGSAPLPGLGSVSSRYRKTSSADDLTFRSRTPRAQEGVLRPHKYQEVRRHDHTAMRSRSTTPTFTPPRFTSMVDGYTGEYNIVVEGTSRLLLALSVPYYFLVSLKWWKLMVMSLFFYIIINLSFAVVYTLPCNLAYWVPSLKDSLIDENRRNTHACDFSLAYAFSVETLCTIGYGVQFPHGPWDQFWVMVEGWVSLLIVPCFAAVIFQKVLSARRMRHTLVFSQSAVINDATQVWGKGNTLETKRALSIRVCSLMKHAPVEVAAVLYLIQDRGASDAPEISIEPLSWIASFEKREPEAGKRTLPAPYLALPATLVHVIDDTSPLFGCSFESMTQSRAQVVAVVEAHDDVSYQVVQAKSGYDAHSIIFDAVFDPGMILRNDHTGTYDLDMCRFDTTLAVVDAITPIFSDYGTMSDKAKPV
ncbi:Inward rectifier potassium channel Kirbac3.1 [Diplonema papillatum]|nr:Inward rectifier potassium channel Kirbac3.1 [Diplonema papillatum]